MPDINSPEFWDSFYLSGQTGWDLGRSAPVFERLVRSGRFPPGRMMVVGAGRGHDARLFAQHGFEVIAADISAQAVRDMRALADPEASVEVLQADLFELPAALDRSCDYVLEYTCFCAIDPRRRGEYAGRIARLLAPGGILIALLFPVTRHAGGPPFAVDPEVFVGLLADQGFTLLERESPPDSHPPRRGIEELVILKKGDGKE